MESNNKYLNIFLVFVLGVFGVTCLIIAVSFSVRASTASLSVAMREMIVSQRNIEAKITENTALAVRVAALEDEVKMLRQGMLGPDSGAKLRQLLGKQKPPAQPSTEDFKKVYDLPLTGSYIFGKPEAKVTFVEFSDFQCPYCVHFHPVIMDLVKAFPDDVRVVMKNFPLPMHAQARPAAKAALAAGLQGKYYEMIALIMENSKNLSDDKYKELAGELKLDVMKFVKDLKEQDAVFEKSIEADVALGNKSDVRGTPTYFINGRKSPSRDLEGWKAEVKAILGK